MRDEQRQTREDSATQPLGCWKAEFRNIVMSGKFCTLVMSYIYQISLDEYIGRLKARGAFTNTRQVFCSEDR